MLYNVENVWYFFISPEKFIFDHFSAKIGCVSEKGVFVFVFVFFFRALWKWVSEWSDFSGEKKTKQNAFRFFFSVKKKKHLHNLKNCFFPVFWPFLTFFWGHPLFLASEWLANFYNVLFFNYFFFWNNRKKKQNSLRNWVNEWVVNFSGEKNTIPLNVEKTKSKVSSQIEFERTEFDSQSSEVQNFQRCKNRLPACL